LVRHFFPHGAMALAARLAATTAVARPAVKRTVVARTAVRAMASSAPAKTPVASLLGCMTIGWKFASTECDDDVSRDLIATFLEAGHHELDTALAYSGGETEKIMARVFSQNPELLAKSKVATKANPWPGGVMTSAAGKGGLCPEDLRKQVERSLESLSPAKIDLLYLHAPDSATPIEDTLAELAKLYQEGKFTRLGLSNFPAWEVVWISGLCPSYGLPKPDTYQGMYNCLTRSCEAELIPALRALKMRFVVYNPLAGGLLTGKHSGTFDGDPSEKTAARRGRFRENPMYRDRFWKREYFHAVDEITKACAASGEAGLTPTSAALRWLYAHSKLSGDHGDGVILGASSVDHLKLNLEAADVAAKGGALPENVLLAIEKAHRACLPVAPPYSRGHSKVR